MFNNVYQEYINNMIGTIPKSHFDFQDDTYRNANIELERFYPELYKLLYPMIQSACMRNTKPITKETIDEMVRDIYSNFNADDVTILNINLTNEVRSSAKTKISKNTSETRSEEKVEEKKLRPNNYVLNDLIRILVIRELLGKTGDAHTVRQGFSSGFSANLEFMPRKWGDNEANYNMFF